VAGRLPGDHLAAGDIGDSISYGIAGFASYGRDVVTRPRLAPNNYRIFVRAWASSFPSRSQRAGTVDYSASLDGILFARGTPRSRSAARGRSASNVRRFAGSYGIAGIVGLPSEVVAQLAWSRTSTGCSCPAARRLLLPGQDRRRIDYAPQLDAVSRGVGRTTDLRPAGGQHATTIAYAVEPIPTPRVEQQPGQRRLSCAIKDRAW